MEVARNSLFDGHLGEKKMDNRIHTNFLWPGLHDEVTSFCRLFDVCQKTMPSGSVPRALFGNMPLIGEPSKELGLI